MSVTYSSRHENTSRNHGDGDGGDGGSGDEEKEKAVVVKKMKKDGGKIK